MSYLEEANVKVSGYIEELRVLLCGVIDGTVDSKDVSDSLTTLEVLQEEYTVVSDSLKDSDEVIRNIRNLFSSQTVSRILNNG